MSTSYINTLSCFFKTQPVDKAWVFGSFARGEETAESDIDILVKFSPEAHISLFGYLHMRNELKDLLERDVDLVEEGQLKSFAIDSADRDKILVYERTT